MNIVLLIAQLILGIVFLITGFGKIIAYRHLKKFVEARTKGPPIGIPPKQAAIIGVSEVIWGSGEILPIHFSHYPFLVALVCSALLALSMMGATYYHMKRKETAAPSICLFLLACFIIVGRWPWWG
jgi:uncharacterized membrane protein YphA (DoxX/SURF4 family)